MTACYLWVFVKNKSTGKSTGTLKLVNTFFSALQFVESERVMSLLDMV